MPSSSGLNMRQTAISHQDWPGVHFACTSANKQAKTLQLKICKRLYGVGVPRWYNPCSFNDVSRMQQLYSFERYDDLWIFSLQHRAQNGWGPPSLLSNGYQGLFPWWRNGRGVKLTTHLHLVLRSKNAWSYTSAPPLRLHGVVLS
jgi:hypothetical protein